MLDTFLKFSFYVFNIIYLDIHMFLYAPIHELLALVFQVHIMCDMALRLFLFLQNANLSF